MMIKAVLVILLTAGLFTLQVGCRSSLSYQKKGKLCDDRAKPASVAPASEAEPADPTEAPVPVPTPPEP